jgi:hypothetical protein
LISSWTSVLDWQRISTNLVQMLGLAFPAANSGAVLTSNLR